MNGTILGTIDNQVVYQDNHTKPNGNVFVVGGPGSFKTQSFIITNVLAETENSIVCTDPKGEVYESTATIKAKQGYKVYVLNYTDMLHSNRQNPLDYITRDTHATNVSTFIVEAENKDGKKDVWFHTQRQLLRAIILYVINELPPKDRNFNGIIDFLQAYDTEKSDDDISQLDEVFLALPLRHPARRAYELGFKKSQGEMQGSIISSLLGTIASYIDDEVGEFTSFSDFHLKDIGREKTILYVIIPPMDNTYEGLINLFFMQLFQQLYDLGSENNAKLPVSVNFELDEFVNLGKFNNYEEFLATCRGYGIQVHTICQTLTQLQAKYGKDKAESIIGNHAIQICLKASNLTTAKHFSGMLNKATVKYETTNVSQTQSKETSTSHSEGQNITGRNLMNVDEIMLMNQFESLIFFSDRRPVKARKAVQWEIFPNVMEMFPRISQKQFKPKASQSQLEILKQKEVEFAKKVSKQKEEVQEEIKEVENDGIEKQKGKLSKESLDLLEQFEEFEEL